MIQCKFIGFPGNSRARKSVVLHIRNHQKQLPWASGIHYLHLSQQPSPHCALGAASSKMPDSYSQLHHTLKISPLQYWRIWAPGHHSNCRPTHDLNNAHEDIHIWYVYVYHSHYWQAVKQWDRLLSTVNSLSHCTSQNNCNAALIFLKISWAVLYSAPGIWDTHNPW